MIIEHTFVTTHEAKDAFRLATDMLSRRGFMPEPSTTPKTNQWSRGVAPGKVTRHAAKLPQSIRMEFDRHRILIAASIDAPAVHRKSARKLMFAYAESMESLLASNQMADVALAGADKAEGEVKHSEGFRFFRTLGIVAAIFLVTMAFVVIAVEREEKMALRRPQPGNSSVVQGTPRPRQMGNRSPNSLPIVTPSPRPAPARANSKSTPQITVRRAPAKADPDATKSPE